MDEHASRAYFNSLRRRLRRFARSFGERSVNTVSQDELEKWMRGLNVGKRTHNNERQVLVTFFNWCQTKRYLPRGVEHEAAQLKVMHAPARVTIYTIAETARLMAQLTARTELVPYAAIGFFAGVRPAELARLRFEEALRWKHGDIEIRADQSKTGFRRLVPMTANLQAWLQPFAARHGLIAPRQADDKLAAFAKHMGLPWPRDVMRHSYISYTVARTEQIGGVALWAGNSEGVVKTNYLEMVTKAEGEAYGGILPKWAGERRASRGLARQRASFLGADEAGLAVFVERGAGEENAPAVSPVGNHTVADAPLQGARREPEILRGRLEVEFIDGSQCLNAAHGFGFGGLQATEDLLDLRGKQVGEDA